MTDQTNDAVMDFAFEDDQDDEEYSNDDVKNLIRAWICERCAPEILPYKKHLLDNLLEMIEVQVCNIESFENSDADTAFKIILYQQEIERIKYIIRGYLRSRLKKIEMFSMHQLSNIELRSNLSDMEILYAENFNDLLSQYYNKSGLKVLNERLQQIDLENMIVRPDLEDAVFCRTKREVGEFQVDEGNRAVIMNFEPGSVYIIRYRWIKGLIADGSLELL
ncbi:DNA replication complex GINS protein SLD5 [Nowakowskiella sp. JEL0407]|nr:DNA replication complex GINS protein SLD5 [Nowakowskiella sp. JEL0407]